MSINKLLIIILCVLIGVSSNAQDEDTTTTSLLLLVIPSMPSPNKTDLVLSDSAIQLGAQNLIDMIGQQSAIFIKSYGVNGVSNLNFRGGKAEHSRIYYKGADLSLLNLGQLDLSLYPLGAGNIASLSYGNAAKEIGGDAINGALSFGQHYNSSDTLSILASLLYSSVQNISGLSRVETRLSDKVNASAFLSYSQGKNTFTFTNPYLIDNQIDTMNNSSFNDLAGGVDFQLKQKENVWSFGTWHKSIYRQIPPGNSQTTYSNESLEDNVHFASLGFHRDKKVQVSYTGAWLTNNNDYVHQNAGLNSNNGIHSIQNIIKISDGREMYLPVKWSNSIRSNYSVANSDGLDGKQSIHDLSYFGKASYLFRNKWRFSAGLRTGLNNSEIIGLLPSASVSYRPKLNNNFVVMANSSLNKRFPTLNELYWIPSGNPDLKPERIAITELGVKINRRLSFARLSSAVFMYYNITDNWTQWLPGPTFWSPINLKQVESKGVEFDLNLSSPMGSRIKYNVGVKANYNYTSNRQVYELGFTDPGNEIIYNPSWNINILASLVYKSWTLVYHQPYVGRYFISNDNQYFMPSYSTTNFRVSKLLSRKNHEWHLAVSVDNLLDWQYQVIPGRPMPGRVFNFNLIYKLKR